MNGPRTGREALLAEILGDMDGLLIRMDAATEQLAQVRDSIGTVNAANVAPFVQALDDATEKVNSAMILRIDDFVNVANETLVRFNDKTQGIKDQLASVSGVIQAAPTASPAARRLDPISFIFGGVVFLAGCLVGLLIK